MTAPTAGSDDTVFLAFDEPDGDRSVVLEDDGEVAYAYLLVDGRIVSDVWLYNAVLPDPDEVWVAKNLPFQNRASHGADGGVPRLRPESDVALDWSQWEVAIEIDGILVARMKADIKPGWSLGATSPSAFALPLSMYPAMRAS